MRSRRDGGRETGSRGTLPARAGVRLWTDPPCRCPPTSEPQPHPDQSMRLEKGFEAAKVGMITWAQGGPQALESRAQAWVSQQNPRGPSMLLGGHGLGLGSARSVLRDTRGPLSQALEESQRRGRF